ncbi:cytochrome c oxidase subunit 3 [Pedobacter sp. MC2016-14]|uniref:cytochrome c oxidase subunit 3 n=1 Tax=Pedobacter sp. MC2016-14 TaxID=2897327 RepID=UPI001E4B19E7|nr:cytochrome c oxidase subunit 3 [Pedobacter sp. MC2016-14]MCD0487690.1 cytochrome c oxidase subunit 3 [Pedobacter sp. MC2016-14]
MVHTLKEEDIKLDYRPQKFIIWLFVVSSTIMFGGFTSYYIVFAASKGKGHGLVLPDLFIYSTVVLVLSSIFLFLAARQLRIGNIARQRMFLWLTLGLGIAFGYLQVDAWSSMVNSGAVLINNNAAISLIYIVSGMHLLHILAGLCLVGSNLFGTYQNISIEKRQYRMDIAAIFWHFIDILWIYLYVFLLLNS